MSRNAPQTLSVKRKRNDVPPDSLVVEQRADTPSKRLKSDIFSLKNKQDQGEDDAKRGKSDAPEGKIIWRRINIPRGPLPPSAASPPPQTPTRRFHISRASGNIVLFEDRTAEGGAQTPQGGLEAEVPAQPNRTPTATPQTAHQRTPVPRKRPGAGASLKPKDAQATQKLHSASNGPSPELMREFEKFSAQVENDEIPKRRTPIKPKAPKLRYKDRHPPNSSKHPDAMDLDSEDYVIDTYVREIIMPDADGKLAQVEGTVGFIVLSEEDEAWWFEEDESDKEFDTDDEDENAEDYYANDYPEDELSSDDEFDRGGYNHYRGEGEEEFDLNDDDARSDVEDDIPLPQTMPKSRAVYWGRTGEQ